MKAWRWVVFPSLLVLVAALVLPMISKWYEDYVNPPPGHWRNAGIQASNAKQKMKCFSRAIEQDPDDHEAYWRRGMSLAELNRLDEAIADVTTATRMKTKCEYLHNLGDLYVSKGETNQAIDLYTKALQLRPGNLVLLKQRGKLLVQQGRYDEAVSDFTAAIAIDPLSVEPYRSRAAACEKLNRREQAAADQKKAESLTTR